MLAGLTGTFGAVTVVWHDWIEIAFGVDPDHGSGSLEWLCVAVFAAAAISFALLARAEWRARAHG
jgi:hypothetical protein